MVVLEASGIQFEPIPQVIPVRRIGHFPDDIRLHEQPADDPVVRHEPLGVGLEPVFEFVPERCVGQLSVGGVVSDALLDRGNETHCAASNRQSESGRALV